MLLGIGIISDGKNVIIVTLIMLRSCSCTYLILIRTMTGGSDFTTNDVYKYQIFLGTCIYF